MTSQFYMPMGDGIHVIARPKTVIGARTCLVCALQHTPIHEKKTYLVGPHVHTCGFCVVTE